MASKVEENHENVDSTPTTLNLTTPTPILTPNPNPNPNPEKSKKSFFSKMSFFDKKQRNSSDNVEEDEEDLARPERWSMGVLNDPHTHEVPGKALQNHHPDQKLRSFPA